MNEADLFFHFRVGRLSFARLHQPATIYTRSGVWRRVFWRFMFKHPRKQ